MIYMNETHERIYLDMCARDQTGDDRERRGCFYLIALICCIHNNTPDSFYNFGERCIIPESINRPELTGNTSRALRLAYVLYNGFPSGNDPDSNTNNGINNIFRYGGGLNAYFLEALVIRYDIPAGIMLTGI